MATIPRYGGEQFGHRADQYLPPGNWQGVPGGFGGQLFTPNDPSMGTDRGIGSDPRIVQANDSMGNPFRSQWSPAATNRFAAGNWDPGMNPDEWDAGRADRLHARNAQYIHQGGPAPVPPGYPGVPLSSANTGGQYTPPAGSQAPQAALGPQVSGQYMGPNTGAKAGIAGRTNAQQTGQYEGVNPYLAPPGSVGPGGGAPATGPFGSYSDDMIDFGARLGARPDQGTAIQRALMTQNFGNPGAYQHAPSLQQFSRASVDPRIAGQFSPADQQMLQDYASQYNQRWSGGAGGGAAAPGAGARPEAAVAPGQGSGASRMQRFTNVANRQAQHATQRGQDRLGNMLGAQIGDVVNSMPQYQGGGFGMPQRSPFMGGLGGSITGSFGGGGGMGATLSNFGGGGWGPDAFGGGGGSPFMGQDSMGGYDPNGRPMRRLAMGGAPMGYDAGFFNNGY